MDRNAKLFLGALVLVLLLIMVTKHSHADAAPPVLAPAGVTR